jgi:hypothetical protein
LTLEPLEAGIVAIVRNGSKARGNTMATMKALPVACTLGAAELRERLGLITTLTRDSLMSYRRSDLALELRYPPDALDRVRAMVAGESHCCPFLDFALREEAAVVRVTITAPDRAREAADELFAYFIAGAAALQDR